MASFSPTDAALTGFRVVREHPKALIGWILLQFILSLTTSLALVGFAGPSVARLQTEGLQLLTDPVTAEAFQRQLLPALGVILLVILIIYPLFNAAMNRAVMRPQDDRFGYLRVGADELRQLGLIMIFMAMGLAAEIVLVTVVVTVATTLHAVAGPVAGALGGLLVLGAGLAGLVVVGVRLSLASALTFATGRVNPFGSWAMTRGHGRPIFFALCIALATSVLVGVLGIVVIQASMSAVWVVVAGRAAPMATTPSSIAAFLTPFELGYTALTAALNGLMLPLMLTPPATIYKSLAPVGTKALIDKMFA